MVDDVVEEGGFEPPKSMTTDLQSAPFGHSGTPPYKLLRQLRWSWWTDSNPRPADYKSAALPAELHQHFKAALIIANLTPLVNVSCPIFLCLN